MTSTDHRPQEQAPVVVAVMKPQAKKQARRRTHASRPYQERLVNMGEARREIVSALKIHRASTRHHQQQPCTPPYHQRQADTLLLRRQPPPTTLQQQHDQKLQQQQVQVAFQDDGSQAVPASRYASFAAAPGGISYYSPPVLPCDLTQVEATMPSVAMGGYGLAEQLARVGLPAQPPGLNLSFQGFGGSASADGVTSWPDDCEDDLYGVPVPAVIQSATSPADAASSSYPATEMASGGGSPALSSRTAEKYSSPAAADAWWSNILLESMESGGGEVAAEDGAVAAAGGRFAGGVAAAVVVRR
ncbi:unnamed protein product [Urochloa humidicola]